MARETALVHTLGRFRPPELFRSTPFSDSSRRLNCEEIAESTDHVYIDAFAGAGVHKSKMTGEEIDGSPVNAVNTQPPFKEYHFIDLNGKKVDHLNSLFGQRSDINIHHGDCNQIMLEKVLPKVQWKDYRRGLCLLDP